MSQKISIQITLPQRLQKRKLEKTTIEFAFYEGQLSEKDKFIFFFSSPLFWSLKSGKTHANFCGEIATSSSVLDHRVSPCIYTENDYFREQWKDLKNNIVITSNSYHQTNALRTNFVAKLSEKFFLKCTCIEIFDNFLLPNMKDR